MSIPIEEHVQVSAVGIDVDTRAGLDVTTLSLAERVRASLVERETAAECTAILNAARWTPSRKAALALASTLAFVASQQLAMKFGSLQLTTRQIAILTLVLLCHELGHYVAASLLRLGRPLLCLIPFFGGAVTMDVRGEPQCKVAVAIMAGPIPGIAISIALVQAFPYSASVAEWAFQFAWINTLNLLPVSILDGGRLLSLTLFGRSPMLLGVAASSSATVLVGAAVFAWERAAWILMSTVLLLLFAGLVDLHERLRMRRVRRQLDRGISVMPLKAVHFTQGELERLLISWKERSPTLTVPSLATLIEEVVADANQRPMGWAVTACVLTVFAAGLTFGILVLSHLGLRLL